MCRSASPIPSLPDSSNSSSSDRRHDGFNNDDPPQYTAKSSDVAAVRLPTPRFPIAAREEEGKECLPGYEATIYKEGLLSIKWEYTSPFFERSSNRSWDESAYVVLNSTSINIYKSKRVSLLGNMQPGEGLESVKGYKPGKLVKSLTLQNAEVGLAVDYKYRARTLRVRAEMEQFLIYLVTTESLVSWGQAIQSAIDLSPSLDERQDPDYSTLPRIPRAPSSTAAQRAEQERIIRANFPHLLLDEGERRRLQEQENRDGAIDLDALRQAAASRTTLSTTTGPYSGSTPYSPARPQLTSTRTSSYRLSALTTSSTNSPPASYPPSISDSATTPSTSYPGSSATSPRQSYQSIQTDSKILASPTARQTTESERAGAEYARRCLPILREFDPRKHNCIVTGDGRKWKIVYDEDSIDPAGTITSKGPKPKGRLEPVESIPFSFREWDGGGRAVPASAPVSRSGSTGRSSGGGRRGIAAIAASLTSSRHGSRDDLAQQVADLSLAPTPQAPPPCYGDVVGQ